MNRTAFVRARMRAALLIACCLAALCASALHPGTAHALFSTGAHGETVHSVKAFSSGLSVGYDVAEQHTEQIDRDQLTVTLTRSDGSSRRLGNDEYELSPATIPAGFKGDFESKVTYREAGFEVSAPLVIDVNGAYGAQYDSVLVFGRGLPASTYQDKGLTNVTWRLEEEGCAPVWNKAALTHIVDIDTVAPVTISGWFNDAAALQAIELDQMDASRLTTLEGAFQNDAAVTTIDITGWDTGNVESMASCFTQCRALREIVGLGDLDTSNVTSFDNLFSSDTAMRTFDVARWDTGKVTTFFRTFDSCYSLESVDLSAWDTSSCTRMACMFYMYPVPQSSLVSVGDLSNWDVSHVTSMSSMFAYNDKLASPGDLSRWKTSSLLTPLCMFQSCQKLTNVGDIGNWDVSHCTSFLNMFQDCRSLKSLGDLSRWNTANVTNMHQMFHLDTNLSVDCRSWNVNNVTNHDRFNGDGATSVKPPAWK